jgi:hypothetical protein
VTDVGWPSVSSIEGRTLLVEAAIAAQHDRPASTVRPEHCLANNLLTRLPGNLLHGNCSTATARRQLLLGNLLTEHHLFTPNSTTCDQGGPVAEKYSGEAYCVKCKEKRQFEGDVVVNDKGTKMAKGKCSVCGTTLNRILGKA